MDFKLTEEQSALVEAVQAILADHSELAVSNRQGFCHFDHKLQHLLLENGFLDAGRDLGALEAALVTIEASRIPATVEVGASAVVAARLLPDERVEGPIALIGAGNLDKPIRNLPVARTAFVESGDDVLVVKVDAKDVETTPSIYAYPFGRFHTQPDLTRSRRIVGAAATLRQWWRVALAAECAGTVQSAIAFTIDHVNNRHVLGRAVGSYQSVQHRLVQCHMVAQGIQFLTLRAAWSGDPAHADEAACYAQQHVKKFMVDLHQFNGAMGVTNEHLLHFWTYRLRALQSEVGGAHNAAQSIARARWSTRKVAGGRA
ncbi:acyl-CoA dehydrogenase family protein [Steroidobacter flavus]|uniref:Acyl-CoA dehydrogenase family protein n=1 Tax=Steroidobacter flavus TaxID=1842136 RepID=A0ABV8T2B6_9GAMM